MSRNVADEEITQEEINKLLKNSKSKPNKKTNTKEKLTEILENQIDDLVKKYDSIEEELFAYTDLTKSEERDEEFILDKLSSLLKLAIQIIELNPKYLRFLFSKAQCSFAIYVGRGTGDLKFLLDNAYEAINEFLELKLDSAKAWHLLYEICKEKELWKEAKDALNISKELGWEDNKKGVYDDERGYKRGKINHSDLIHRQVAYNLIYLKNRDRYPLPFSRYEVHHKDGDKQNNDVSNLQIVTKEEHDYLHEEKKKK